MFKITTNCPAPVNKERRLCEGYRIDGTLKNDCAKCAAYKAYVEKAVPNKN